MVIDWSFTYIFEVGAVVQIVVPCDLDVVLSWDSVPLRLVCFGELRALLSLAGDHLVHDLRSEAGGDNEDDACNDKAASPAPEFLHSFLFSLSLFGFRSHFLSNI